METILKKIHNISLGLLVIFLAIHLLSYKTELHCSNYEHNVTSVYDACLDSLIDSTSFYPQIILNDSTIKIIGGTNKKAVEIVGEEATLELHKQYTSLNSKSDFITIKKSKFKSKILYLSNVYNVLSKTAKSSGDIFWSELKFKFPKAKSIVSFSKVGFSNENNYALVYMNIAAHYKHSINRLIYLKKTKKGYKIIYIK